MLLVCTLLELPGDLIIILCMLWKVMSFFSLTYTSVSCLTSWHWYFFVYIPYRLCPEPYKLVHQNAVLPSDTDNFCVYLTSYALKQTNLYISKLSDLLHILIIFVCILYRLCPETDKLVHQKFVWLISYTDRFCAYITGYDLSQTNLYISKLFEHLGRMVFEEVDESDKYGFVITGVDSALGERLHFQQVTGVFSFVF